MAVTNLFSSTGDLVTPTVPTSRSGGVVNLFSNVPQPQAQQAEASVSQTQSNPWKKIAEDTTKFLMTPPTLFFSSAIANVFSSIQKNPTVQKTVSDISREISSFRPLGKPVYAPESEQQAQEMVAQKTKQEDTGDWFHQLNKDAGIAVTQLFEGVTGGIVKSKIEQNTTVQKIVGGVSNVIGSAVTIGGINNVFGTILSKSTTVGKVLEAYPKVQKFILPLIKNIVGFDIYGQLDPEQNNRLTRLAQDTVTGTLFTGTGFIKNAPLSVGTNFGLGFGLAKLHGASDKDAFIAGGILAVLDTKNKVQESLFSMKFSKEKFKDMTPDEARAVVINTPLMNTKLGKDIIKTSVVAEQTGQNVRVYMKETGPKGIAKVVGNKEPNIGVLTVEVVPKGTPASERPTETPGKPVQIGTEAKPEDITRTFMQKKDDYTSASDLAQGEFGQQSTAQIGFIAPDTIIARDPVDPAQVERVKADIQAGKTIEPIIVSREGGKLTTVDGTQRLTAYQELGKPVPVIYTGKDQVEGLTTFEKAFTETTPPLSPTEKEAGKPASIDASPQAPAAGEGSAKKISKPPSIGGEIGKETIVQTGLKRMLLGSTENRDKRMEKIIQLPNDKALKALKEEMGSYEGSSLDGGWVDYSKGKLTIKDENHNVIKSFTIPQLLDEAKKLLASKQEDVTPAPVEKKAVQGVTEAPTKPVPVINTVKQAKIYNALNKKAAKRLSLLENFEVQDGKAYYTDLTVEVVTGSELPDGSYKYVGTDAVKTEMSSEDRVAHVEIPSEKETRMEILPEKLIQIAKEARVFVTDTDSRPILTTAKFEIKNGTLTVTATDGYRLYVKNFNVKGIQDGSFLVPNLDTLAQFTDALGDNPVGIRVGKDTISFIGDAGSISMRPVEGEYPKFEKIYPGFQKRITVNQKELLDAIKAIAPYAKSTSMIMRITLKDNTLIVMAQQPESEGGIKKEVTLKAKMEDVTIPNGVIEGSLLMPVRLNNGLDLEENSMQLNYKYLEDIVKVGSTEETIIDFTTKDDSIDPLQAIHLSDTSEVKILYPAEEKPIVTPKPQTTPKKEKPETYNGAYSVGRFADVENVTRNVGPLHAIEFPEMVRIAKELMGGVPLVRMTKAMRNMFERTKGEQVMGGLFRPRGDGKIILNPDVFKDISQTAKTLSHEMGHLIDFLPEKTMSRGNLLGRIASLRKFMSNFLPEMPGGQGTITPEDRERLRKEAKKLAEKPVTVTEEVVVGEIKATPAEILSIWTDNTSSIKSPDLLKYIQTLDTRQKVEIVKEAMKGKIPAWVTFMNTVKKTMTHEVMRNAPEDVRRIYKQLLEEEIRKRRLFQNETIRNELKALTKMWRPYDLERVSDEYIKYRNKSFELYADAVSVLFNDPALLKRDAPTFFKAFFNYIDAKPEVRDNFFAIQNILNKGDEAVYAERDKQLEEAYEKGEDVQYAKTVELQKRKTNLFETVRLLFDNRNQVIWDKVRQAEKMGVKIEDTINPAYGIQGLNYLDAFTKNMIEDSFQPVFEKAQEVPDGWVEVGKVLQLERALYERGEMANPGGFDPKTAKDQLGFMERSIGPENWKKIREAVNQFREGVKKFNEYVAKNKFYTPELLKTMNANESYASFQVIDYLDTYVSAHVYHSIGTLKDVANPATSTVMKMISIAHAVERNNVKNNMVKLLQDRFEKEITPSDTRFAGKKRPKEILEPRDKDKGLVRTIQDGKAVGFYVDKEIARSLNHESNDMIAKTAKVVRLISMSKFYRPLFTTINLGFQSFNARRDFLRYWKNTPDYTFAQAVTSFPRAIYRYIQAAPHALKRIQNKPDEVIKAMEGSKMLGLSYNDMFKDPVDPESKQIERVLQKIGVLDLPEKRKLLTPIYWSLERITMLGDFIESLPKVAGYIEGKVQGRMKEQQLANFVRTKLGSPDFRTDGYATPVTNNLLLFSNAIKESIKSDLSVATGKSESGKYSQSGFWWKNAVSLLPEFLMIAAALGLLGKELKDQMDNVSEYDKSNYDVIPLGLDENGKTIRIRLPLDESGRFIHGLVWKFSHLLGTSGNKDLVSSLMDLVSFGAGQFPNVTPSFIGMGAVLQYVSGNNPYDSFRNRNIIPDQQFKAGWKRSLPIFTSWLLQNQGLGILIPPYVDKNPSKLQKVLGLPILSNILGRWVSSTDYGQTERLRQVSQDVQQKQAEESLRIKDQINEAVKKYNAGGKNPFTKSNIINQTVKTILNSLPKEQRTNEKRSGLKKEINIAIIKGEADPNINALIYARSNEEKIQIINSLKGNIPSDTYRELIQTATKNKIIGPTVLRGIK